MSDGPSGSASCSASGEGGVDRELGLAVPPRLLAALLLLPTLAGCAERCPGAPPQPVFGGGHGVDCRLLTADSGRAAIACFKRCPPREPAEAEAEAEQTDGTSP